MDTDEDKRSQPDGAPPRARAHTVLILASTVSPWAEHLADHLWLIATPAEEPDVVVCLDAESRDRARDYPRASVVHVTRKGESWAGEGANIVLYDPTPEEFVAACDRGWRLMRARAVVAEYVTDILECSPDAFFVLDWDRLVTYQNHGALSFVARFEGGDGDITGEPLDEHIPRDLAEALAPVLAQVFQNPLPRSFECTLPGGLSIEANAYFIPSGAAVYFRDVTARRAAESEALRETGARLTEEAPAGLPRGPTARFDLVPVVEEAARLHGLAHPGGRPVEISLGPSRIVEGEASRILRMVLSLLVDADDSDDEASTIRLTTLSEPSAAVILVETRASRRGSRGGARIVGPALAVAARIAAEHAGTLEILPARAGGSGVAVRLPIEQGVRR